jgi:hypothetical protein
MCSCETKTPGRSTRCHMSLREMRQLTKLLRGTTFALNLLFCDTNKDYFDNIGVLGYLPRRETSYL